MANKYHVVLASIPICRMPDGQKPPFIPGTEQRMILDLGSGMGWEIWTGYLKMRQQQKGLDLPDTDWRKVRLPESDNPEHEPAKVEEAVNIFMRFVTDEGSDNCPAVQSIERIS